MKGTRGQQFLRLRKIEVMDFLKFALRSVDNFRWGLEHYQYESWQAEHLRAEIEFWSKEIEYAEKELEDMGGAENEDTILTEPKRSETPQLEQISCTTVL